MGLARIKRELIRELRTEKSREILEEASRRHMVLLWNTPEAFSSIVGRARWRHSGPVVAAIVKEQQSGVNREVWNALLILAFYPMLVNLRMQLIGNLLPARELDQLVITKLIEAAEQSDARVLERHGVSGLRLGVRRRVFVALRRERRAQKDIVVYSRPLEEIEEDAPSEHRDAEEGAASTKTSLWPEFKRVSKEQPELTQDELDEVIAKIAVAHKRIRWKHVDAVIATQIRGERLTEYVKKKYPDLSEAEIRRFYERIKRAHSRTMALLRDYYGGRNCPRTEPLCLYLVGRFVQTASHENRTRKEKDDE